jgi:hypothetical protein
VQHSTFLEYYQKKYKVEVQLPHQPLLVAQQLGSGALDSPLLPPRQSCSRKRYGLGSMVLPVCGC